MTGELDYTAARFWFDMAHTGVTVLIGVYVWWVNRKKAMEKRFSDMRSAFDARCEVNLKRITSLEATGVDMRAQLEHMPKHSDIKELTSKISELNGRLSGINRAVDLINEFLIKQGGK